MSLVTIPLNKDNELLPLGRGTSRHRPATTATTLAASALGNPWQFPHHPHRIIRPRTALTPAIVSQTLLVLKDGMGRGVPTRIVNTSEGGGGTRKRTLVWDGRWRPSAWLGTERFIETPMKQRSCLTYFYGCSFGIFWKVDSTKVLLVSEIIKR